MAMTTEKLSAEIDRKRKIKKLTNSDLAKIAGVSTTTIHNLTNFKTVPQDESVLAGIKKIACFLNINIIDFIDLSDIKGRISYLCISKELSKWKLSNACGLGHSTIGKWARCVHENPKIETIKKLADYCGVTPEWILYGDKKEPLRNGLIDLPVSQPKPIKTPIFKAKPKTTVSDFVRCDNGSIVEIQSGKFFTESQFNELFEVVA